MPDFSLLDYIALLIFLIVVFGYGWLIRYGPLKTKNIASGVQQARARWIKTMACRENRIVDMQILTNLSQGNAFFASTAIVIAGVLATTLGKADEIASMLNNLPIPAQSTSDMIKIKMIFLMIIFLTAFFKFAWAFRITHYTSIMIGATPLKDNIDTPESKKHINRTIELAGLAGLHSNAGLHTYYYGIAASGWFLNPLVFIIGTLSVLAILYRREYKSASHAILIEDD